METIIARLQAALAGDILTSEDVQALISQLEAHDQEHRLRADHVHDLSADQKQIEQCVREWGEAWGIALEELNDLPQAVEDLLLEVDAKLRGDAAPHQYVVRNTIREALEENDLEWDYEMSHNDAVVKAVKELRAKLRGAVSDAAAMRGTLERIMARGFDPLGDADQNWQRHLLDMIASQARNALSRDAGVDLRVQMRDLENIVDGFERGMRETGGWSYGGDRTLAERVKRCIDHYTRMAAESISGATSFRDGVVSWLRGVAINAQAVSWAATHHEKDARLRGLIEVVETAISELNKARLEDRLSRWNGVVDSWQRSDFPTREMRRRIFDLEAEVKRLGGEVATSSTAPEEPVF